MKTLENPFVVSGYCGKEYFCDREKECSTIIDALRNGRNVVLSAPRKMGKTGLIHRIFEELESDKNLTTIYLDIFSTQNLADFVRLFATSVIGQLDTGSQKTIAQIGKFFSTLKPTFGIDALTGLPQMSVSVADEQKESSLKDVFEYLKQSQRECYIAIDEFQQIAAYPEKGVEALLRSYMQFLPNVRFIFAGSKQHLLQEMFCSAKRPFFQSAQIVSISQIDSNIYYNFARAFFDRHKSNLSEQVFMELYQKFDGYTWYLQSVLNRLYADCDDVTNEKVGAAIMQIVDEYKYFYQQLLATFPAYHTQLLRAIAAENCVAEITAGDFIAKYSLKAASSVRSALEKLLRLELVYKTNSGYIVYDRFMNEWLKQL